MGEGKQQIECYDHERFWTVTGNVLAGFESIGDGQEAVDWLCHTYLTKKSQEPKKESKSSSLSLLQRGQAYADKMRQADQGDMRDSAFRNAGHLHALVGEFNERLSDNDVYHLLRSWNARNATQLRDDELLEAAKNGRTNGTPPDDKPPKGSTSKGSQESPEPAKTNVPITIPAVQLLDEYHEQLSSGRQEQLISLSSVLNGIEIGPGLLSVFGCGPGGGKTTLAMQICFEAVERDPNVKIVIANAETAFSGLLRRELTRMTGIKSHKIRFGPIDESEQSRIRSSVDELRPRLTRMEILQECSLAGLQALRSEPPGGVVVDYLQKFSPSGDPRQGTNQVMATLRDLARLGWWVLCLSATARTNGKGGSGHDSKQLSQASYRESGDIEFNADSCYLLIDNGEVDGDKFKRNVTLSHVKNRHGAKYDRQLVFNMPEQRFENDVDLSELTNWCAPNPFGGDDHER